MNISTLTRLASSLLNATTRCEITSGSTRHMSRIKKRFTMPPFWQPMKTRKMYPENISSENQEFLDEAVKEKFSPVIMETFKKQDWKPKSYRCGLITRKIGVYPMWKKDGSRLLTTLLEVADNHVIKYIPPAEIELHDYHYKGKKRVKKLGALVVGADSADPRLSTKEYYNIFLEAGVMPKKLMHKFYITPNAIVPSGTPLYATHFRPGDRIDCSGTSIDRGFQGVMVRWGFKGNRKTHGTTKSHRRPGSIGSGGKRARVIAGQKMPGHMGRLHRRMLSQRIVRINTKHNLIYVAGTAIPGETGNYVILRDTYHPLRQPTEENHSPFPTDFPEGGEVPENLYDLDIHPFSEPSIMYSDKEESKK